ncbi:hypothetical protein RKD23_002846 [Streptomyces sp. SAI-170]|uniref:hypothetical protein n=1 Tax=Streptomyces sp. SAI-170 TaxID=3377729 RepID=UPI003C7AE24D
MNRSTGARLCATAVVGAMSLALLTGCSDSGSDDSKNTGSGGASENAKTYTKAELEKLIIAQGDVTGYKVEPLEKSAVVAKDDIKAEEKCLPLTYVMSGLAPGDAAAETNTGAMQEKKPSDTASKSLDDLTDGNAEDAMADAMNVNYAVVGLSSYDGDGAEEVLKSVSDAVKDCAGGFSGTQDGETQKVNKVAEEKSSGTGDESVAFAVTGDMDGTEGTVHAEVVRHGNTLATYYAVNLGALVSGKSYVIPAEVVQAQATKLK